MIDEPNLREQEELDREAASTARELRTKIEFGFSIEKFLAGPLGQRIMADSERDVLGLMEEMVTLDPDDEAGRKRMREIRRRVDILNHWQEAFAHYLRVASDAQTQYIEAGVVGDDEPT